MFKLTKIGHITGSGSPNYLDGAYDVTIHTISAIKYAFVTSFIDDKLTIFNVNNPASPVFVGSLTINQPAKVRCFDDGANSYAVVTSYEDDEVSVIDVTTPATPSVAGTLTGAGTPNYLDGAYGLCLAEISSNWYVFVTSITDNRLVIIDLATPASPALTAVIGGSGTPNYCDGCHDVYVAEITSNWYAFVISQDDNSLSVFDVEAPGSPALTDSIQTINGAHSICGSGNYVYVSANTDNEVVVIDITNPASISEVGSVAINKPMGVYYKVLDSKKFVFVASYTDDAIKVINVDTPTSPKVVGAISGTGSPNYLDGIHAVVADDDYAYAVSYNDNALVVFETDASYSSLSATIAIETEMTCELTKGAPKALSATIAIETEMTCRLTGGSDWGDQIGKPYWQPARRTYIQKSDDIWVDITEKVADFGTVNWQIEEEYHFNVFTANNCQITLKNEDEEFDIDNANNYFVSTLGQPQDGYRVPIRIACGYVIDGVESLIDVFYGLIIDIDTSTDDDKASIDLQCVSRVLRDAKCDIGDLWENVRLYGGELSLYLDNVLERDDQNWLQKFYGDWLGGATGGSYNNQENMTKSETILFVHPPYSEPTNEFPPSGYFRIDDEIVYFAQNIDNEILAYCIRGCKGTEAAEHGRGDRALYLLLDDGTKSHKHKFQIPVYPIIEDSVTLTTSDGTITILEDREYDFGLLQADKKMYAYVDYDTGVVEFADEPTDKNSVHATFRANPRMITAHGLIKRLLKEEGLDTELIEDAILYEPFGNRLPVRYGRITQTYQSGIVKNIELLQTYSMAVNEDYIYFGIGGYLVKWDGESFETVWNCGHNTMIPQLAFDTEGNLYGITKNLEAGILGRIFKFDGQMLYYLTSTVAEYFNFTECVTHDDQITDGAQWHGFSVDNDRDCIWFLFEDGGDRGIAKVGFDGTGYTTYVRSVFEEGLIDFVDIGDTLEVFYMYRTGGFEYIHYDTLDKDAGTWTSRGNLSGIGGDHEANRWFIPADVAYNPTDDKIYLNVLQWTFLDYWQGWFICIDKNGTTTTLLDTYTQYSYAGKFSGGVAYDGYTWYIKGSKMAIGLQYEDDAFVDDADGMLYKIQNGVMTPIGAMARRPNIDDGLRQNIYGQATKIGIRESEQAFYFIMSDAIVNEDIDFGFSFVKYASNWVPMIRNADIRNRNKWDVMSECAKLSGYELGVTRDGKVFFRQRTIDRAFLSFAIGDAVTTIPTSGDGMDGFEDTGDIQIDSEVITYAGKTANSFTGCVRGAYDSTPASHSALSTIFKVDDVFITMQDDKTIKRVNSKTPNWDEVYNVIIVSYGSYEAMCNYVTTGEVWAGSSEQLYGKRELRIDNDFLTDDDVAIAKALAWRYYDLFNQRHSRIEIETVWQPQLDIGDSISIKQPSRTILDYALTRVRQIQMEIGSFYIKCVATVKPNKYRESISSYPYS
jgi:hypothetical protein